MPTPLDTRKKPANVKVHVSTGAGVDITWSDGHASHYDFIYLRENCPCATCGDERTKNAERAKKAAKVPAPVGTSAPMASSVLPMYKPKPRARSAEAVGHYAIKIDFSDGHGSGIYSFDYLRTMCPCDACAREFRGA
jgi:DUF971 family protein